MKTIHYFLPSLALLTLVTAAAGQDSRPFSELKKEIQKLFADSAATPKERTDAMVKIGTLDCKDSVDLLVSLLEKKSPEETGLLKAAKDIEEKIEAIYARNRSMLKKNMIDRNDQIEIGRLTMELNNVNKRLNSLQVVKNTTDDALSRCKSQVEYMITRIFRRSGDWQTRLEVLQACAQIGTDESLACVHEAFTDKEHPVRAEALDLSLKKSIKGLEDRYVEALKDDWWQVRSSAVKAILHLKVYKAVGALIDALQVEDGRLTLEMDEALQALTGKTYYGDAELWARWWTANKEKFLGEGQSPAGQPGEAPQAGSPGAAGGQGAVPPDGGHKGPGATTSFYGIKTASKRIIFVLDVSGSMLQKSTTAPAEPPPPVTGGGTDDPAARFRPKDDTKMEIAKCELKRAIGNLPEDALFTMVFYNHEVEVWSQKMVQATKSGKENAYRFIDAKEATGNTNIHDSLKAAFDVNMAEKGGGSGGVQVTGSKDKKTTRGGVDTIFFLTDGFATSGQVVEPAAILEAVRLWNGPRKIQIHTVGVGEHDKDFLGKLASENGGTYVAK